MAEARDDLVQGLKDRLPTEAEIDSAAHAATAIAVAMEVDGGLKISGENGEPMKIAKVDPAQAEVDMTPMIDIVFQLIAFFMVITNFENVRADERVKLPKDQLAKPPEEPDGEIDPYTPEGQEYLVKKAVSDHFQKFFDQIDSASEEEKAKIEQLRQEYPELFSFEGTGEVAGHHAERILGARVEARGHIRRRRRPADAAAIGEDVVVEHVVVVTRLLPRELNRRRIAVHRAET